MGESILARVPSNASGIINFINALADNPTEENVESLEQLLQERDPDSYSRPTVAAYSARMMLALKEEGITRLDALYATAPSPTYSKAILDTLYRTSLKEYVDPWVTDPAIRRPDITDSMAALARQVFNKRVTESLTNFQVLEHLIQLLGQYAIKDRTEDGGRDSRNLISTIFLAYTDASVALPRYVIDEYNALISAQRPEEEYQQFLSQYPSMLDPLAKRVIPKQKLGIEHVTDFVVERLDGRYILVEIEKPQDRLFNGHGDFSAQFSHALGQILDFQEWVEKNIAYADRLLPNIISPTGLLIMGLRRDLSPGDLGKLNRFNINNGGRVLVMGFDDVEAAAVRLHNNFFSA